MKKKTPAVYNKQGTRFGHCVAVARDPNTDPTYSYKFPVVRNGHVKELWARKVRPIPSMTRYLHGCSLKRYRDYVVQYDRGQYQYWFRKGKYATLFAIAVSGVLATPVKGHRFQIECPHCHGKFDRQQIVWHT
tara:strand:+ start:110 stop:508 length:399 start_codon:yes stop_codon:yes gene_type:complete